MAMFGFGGNKNSAPSVVSRISDYFGWIGNGSDVAPALTHKTAMETTAVLCAVRTIAEGVAQTPIRLIEKYTESGLERTRIAATHPMHKLLARPNSFQTSFEFIEGMVSNAVLGKGALAIKVQVGSEVRELIPVPASSWVMEVMSDTSFNFRVTFSDGSQRLFSQDQVVFFRGTSLDGYSSISALEAARKAVGISSGLESQSLRSASSGGRPSGILTFPDSMSPETKEKLRNTWQERYAAGGAGGIAVLDGQSSFTAMQMSAADNQFLESRNHQINEIARIFKVQPAFLFADGEKIDPSVMRFHVTQCLVPWMIRMEMALNRDLLKGADQDKYSFDFDEMNHLRGDWATMTPFFQAALGNGGAQSFLTVNEIRRELGQDPINEKWAKTVSKGGYAQVAGMTEKKDMPQ